MLRIIIWLIIGSIVISWALLMSWIIDDVHHLIADPTSDQIDESL